VLRLGTVMSHPEIEALTGQTVTPTIATWSPMGARLLIVKQLVKDTVGHIVLAESTRAMERSGAGWIVGVGPQAQIYRNPIGYLEFDEPEDILGQMVTFSCHAGTALRLSVFDSEFESDVSYFMPADIMGVCTDPQVGFDFEASYLITKQGLEDQASEDIRELRASIVGPQL
jgi:hypothetical protein